VVNDPLPGGPGIHWSVASGPANCTISGPDGSQVLHCTAVDLAPGASESVHITSPTQWTKTADVTVNSCLGGNGKGEYDNTATAQGSNTGEVQSSDSTTVLCP